MMDGLFSLPEAARTVFLRSLVHSFGCTYICLWQYSPNLLNRLFFLDGFYNVTNNQPSSSSESSVAAERLFHQYQRLTFDVNDDCVPGLAFRNHLPYLELHQVDLLRLTSTEIQTQFFQEARIKTAVFMGCNKGEIELGFTNVSQADIQTALWNLFPEDFSIQSQLIYQNLPPPSSSSDLISLSTSSTENSSLLFNIPGTSQFPETLQPVPATQTSPYQQTIQVIPSQLPTPEGEHDAIVRAFLHVISSRNSSTSHQHQPQQNLPYTSLIQPEATAFKGYIPDNNIGPPITPQMGSNFRRQSLMNRSFAFFGSLNLMRMRERIQALPRPTSTQLHHVISERRRREKLKENFQTLRALLPPGTKRDKASILTAAKETMSSLMAEIEKLGSRNHKLMTLLSANEAITEENKASSSNEERVNVWVSDVSEASSSHEGTVNLRVTVRGETSQVDILVRLLEFLKRVQNVSLISMDATQGTAINQLTFRLSIIEGSEWDESAFQEAVRRVVADLAQWQLPNNHNPLQ